MIATDLVHSAQRTFRALLTALSHPGRVLPIEDPVEAPAALGGALAAAALALLDREVAVWVAAPERSGIGPWLVAQTACRLVADPSRAHFAVILNPEDALPLERWNSGTPEDPEESATLLVRVDSCTAGAAIRFDGPGIETDVSIRLHTMPQRFWLDRSANAERYPLGLDCFFFDERHVVGLPRTARERTA